MWFGSTTLQRYHAMEAIPGVDVVRLDRIFGAPTNRAPSLYQRVRWKLRWPVDAGNENQRLLDAAARSRPDAVIVENSRVIRRSTLRKLRELGVAALVYYTPDDIIGPHNLSWSVRLTFPEWDVFFTTKTFNIPELAARGVRRPVLVGNAFDPELNRPLTPAEVGEEFERWDLVFVGTYEKERCASINQLARQGMSVVVYGSDWRRSMLAPEVVLRPQQLGPDYTRAMHTGKVALCFLRKINRDRITTRTLEITAMARPMLGEKTDEHDEHFVDGAEYIGFSNEDEIVTKARLLLGDTSLRSRVAAAGRSRCVASGYSTAHRAAQMLEEVTKAVDRRASASHADAAGT